MRYDPEKHHRRSIRLKGYDYSREGAYFVTICTQDRLCLFGEVVEGEMRLNDAGQMVERWWVELNRKFPGVRTDEYIIMPNHFHGIIVIVGADPCVCHDDEMVAHANQMGTHAGAPLPKIIQWFKTMTTNEYIRGVKQSGWTPFRRRLWQRNYYEHIIRNEDSLNRIRHYIATNPLRWHLDRENPERLGKDEFDQWLKSFGKGGTSHAR
ncbi:hypothetical protein HRbin17_02511 [bacterium HR17]|jgi:REP element-mobilizing transposase RayT|uniref:Transposase IS200-like domain-containing protein n=1 Tax=Candidatus Fervidibacter japonicus TaxID=2035412 RepID=A0A2H5XFM3_9BACT|nr:hypothetical protein HRbin17_02511 [bacterium HR17]